ncbi:hypothetical protein ACQV2B_02955 [Pantoea allii]|uniref:hypothetical protein n=1 Tax=Pantoea allii TaxID=574096 RepID=UPI003D31CD57
MAMANFSIICDIKIKWWVVPLITAGKIYVKVTRHQIDVDRLADFISEHGIKKKFITKEI